MVGMVDDVRRAFRVSGDRRAGMLRLELDQFGLGKGLVDDADSGPQQHVAAGASGEVAPEVAVGAEDDLLVLRDLAEDDVRAAAGNDDIGERLHLRRAVDVGQRDMVRMRGAEGGELVGRAAVLERTAGVHVGQDDGLFRREDLGGLGHEADPAEGDDVGVGGGGLARQVEAVADEISQVLKLGLLVVMRQDDGVAFLLEALDLGQEVDAGEAGGSVHVSRDRSPIRARQCPPPSPARRAGGGPARPAGGSRPGPVRSPGWRGGPG